MKRKQVFSLSRRRFLESIAALGIGGCSVSPMINRTSQSLEHAIQGLPDVPITREQIDKIPYATVSAKIGKGPRSLLILGRYDNGDLHWISEDRSAIATREGRIVKTAGFPRNLVDTRYIGEDPLAQGVAALRAKQVFRRLVDVTPGNYFNVRVDAWLEPVAEEQITILEIDYPALRIREQSESPLLEWEFVNEYWVDRSTGFVWQSIQHFAPDMPPVELQVLKPAAAPE